MDSYWVVLPANNAVATIRDVASRAIRQTENEMRAKLPFQAVVAQLSPPRYRYPDDQHLRRQR